MTDNNISIGYYADHDISETNCLETVIVLENDDIEAIVIDTWIYFPFPKVAGIDVTVHLGMLDVDLVSSDPSDNLENYSWHMVETEGYY